jgi:GTP cyclohydrolase I
MELKEALEKITDNLAQLLKNNLKPQDDLLVLEAQELALQLLYANN